MEYKYQPKTKGELKKLCKNKSIYLGDIDTSLITDMSGVFSFPIAPTFQGLKIGTPPELKTCPACLNWH